MKQHATHNQRHTANALKKKACYGCSSMCVIERGRKIRIEEYWCDRLHGVVEPPEECPHRRGETR